MSNKYDKILGKYRVNDSAIGTAIYGADINSVLYTNNGGVLTTDPLFDYSTSVAARVLTIGDPTDSKQAALSAKAGLGNYGSSAGAVTTYYSAASSVVSGDVNIPVSYYARIETDAVSSFAQLNMGESVNGDSLILGLHDLSFSDATGILPFRIYDNSVESMRFEAGSRILAGSHAFGSGDFTVFEFGNDGGGVFSGTPFRAWWDDTGGYLTWDDGGSGLLYLRANLTADYLTSTTSSLGTITGTSAALTPTANTTTVPLTVQGASAASNIAVTFTYTPAQTFTVTIASPGVLTTPLAHGLSANDCVRLSTTGALPTGLGTTTVYYVRNPGTDTLELSTTSGGASINTSGTQSGTHTITPLAKCTTGVAHGRSFRDPIFFAGGTPMPTGVTAGTTYYVSDKGLTSTQFYFGIGTIISAAQHVAITTSGGGSPYIYGQNTDHSRIYNSAGTLLGYVDKFGNTYGNLTTMPWRIGIIPGDSNYSGIWFSSAAVAPSSSNYSFLGDPTNTFLNGPTNLWFRVGNVNQCYLSAGYFNFSEGVNFVLGTTTGTKFGNATNQKLAFFGSTAIVQPVNTVAINDVLVNLGLRASGGVSNFTSDMIFEGSGVGLPYGSCWGNEIAWAQATAAQNTWYSVSDADMTDGQLNLVTHDGSGKLTLSTAGRYLVNYAVSAEVSAPNKHVQTGISLSGTVQNDGICHFEGITAAAQFHLSSSAILSVAANATIEVALRTTDAGTPDLSVDHLNITVVHIGG